ncbi:MULTISPECIES: toxin-antitoxin system, toxin component [unclassified Streptomyces]|uniref:toxin-antitoxin system, toxin component n=2 Tax=unclassified Streptomyces TaxID=2593676 RepID=UPI002DD8F94A|nr:toxin-antitoxin system, toxin component [Streptomyces sp. NBC_01558]WSD76980.1 toxin-antitoxin system, toxin component [Streptomyces sp. NBC_01558]
MRKAKVMRRLVDTLVDEVRLPVPTTPDALFGELIRAVGKGTGRELELVKERFPYGTASGLWLDLPDRDLVVVEQRATPLHQLAIFFHEVWHLETGTCASHVVGRPVAARMLSTRPDLPQLAETVRRVAARSDFSRVEEADAERFGLLAVTRFRMWLEGEDDGPSADLGEIAGRIGASLGSRRRQV